MGLPVARDDMGKRGDEERIWCRMASLACRERYNAARCVNAISVESQ